MKRLFRQQKSEKQTLAAAPDAKDGKGTGVAPSSLALPASVGVSARASSHSIPDFGFVSVQNSRGASGAIAELSNHFDILLADWNSNDEFGARRRQLENKLRKQAEEHVNARLDIQHGVSPWQHTSVDVTILTAAIKCSVAAYDPSARVPSDDTLAFTAIHSIPASTSGVIKATTFTRVTSAASCQQLPAERSFSALVIAVRGSMKMIDWVVNANYEPCDAYDLLASAEWLPNERVHDTFRVHSGFLNGARALLPVVKEQLASTVGSGSDRASHVIFTGHSAGGAVASLLYLHFLGIASQTYPFLRFSLVTFGSPPVIAPSVTTLVNEHLKHQTNPGLAVAVVNETDVVTRADNLYLSSLVDLYKSIDSLAPVAETTAQAQPRTRDGRYWQLPPPVYYLIGNVVVLKELDEESDDPTITAFSVSESDFSRLLFCSSRAHHKEVYQLAVERLRHAEKVLAETTI